MEKQEWLELVEKHFKQAAIDFTKESVVKELLPAADAYVLASPNKIDDVAWAMAKEAILKGLENLK